MNNDYGGNRCLMRTRLLPAMAAVAVLATACSGTTSSSFSEGSAPGGSANYQKALSYSECMRAHGVANFPDPDAQGNIIQHVSGNQPDDEDNPVFQAADNTCHHLLPGGGGAPISANSQVVKEYLKFAQCMRAHGVPNYPDPKVAPGVFDINLGSGIDLNSPRFQAAEGTCKSLIPASMLPSAS